MEEPRGPLVLGYEPPPPARGRPAVILWFRVYAVATLLLYLGFVGFLLLWQFLAPGDPNADQGDTPGSLVVTLVGLGVFAFAFGAFHLAAAMVPFRPWGWTVGLIAICLGLSGFTMLAAIPLLVFWMKPETKAAFGRL